NVKTKSPHPVENHHESNGQSNGHHTNGKVPSSNNPQPTTKTQKQWESDESWVNDPNEDLVRDPNEFAKDDPWPTLTTEDGDAQLLRHIKAESDRLRHLRSNTLPGLVPTSGEVNPYAASDARLLEGLWNSLHHPDQEVTNYKMVKVEVKPEPEPEPESESGA